MSPLLNPSRKKVLLVSSILQNDDHLLTVMRYVKRSPVRGNSIELAEDWHWNSAYVRRRSSLAIPDDLPLPPNWRSWVNKVETKAK